MKLFPTQNVYDCLIFILKIFLGLLYIFGNSGNIINNCKFIFFFI